MIDDTSSYPAYAQVTPRANLCTAWTTITNDTRALQKAGMSTRIAACYYTENLSAGTSFALDVTSLTNLPILSLYMR